MRTFIALVVLLLAACGPGAEPPDPGRYGTIRVALGPSTDPGRTYDWTAAQRAEITRGLALLEGMGPAIEVVSEGAPVVDVIVRAAHLEGGCGAFYPDLPYVEVDAACASQRGGFPALQRAVNHEIGHWFLHGRYRFDGHLCAHARDAPECHPTVECPGGDCLMARGLVAVRKGAGYVEAFAEFADPGPADADRRLVRVLAGDGP